MNEKKRRFNLKTMVGCLVFTGLTTGFLASNQYKGREYLREAVTLTSKALPQIDSQQGLLINLTTNKVIAEKKASEKIYPASLTKIMTAYLVIKHLEDLNQIVVVPSKVFDKLQKEGAAMAGFLRDEPVPALALLYGTLLSSGAEATTALAIAVGGSETEFVKLMNHEAQKIGMTQTRFKNVTGLHHSQHYSTVRDLAMLVKTALADERFAEIFTTKEHLYQGGWHPEGLVLSSTVFGNFEYEQDFAGEIIGGKTGYTEKAGQCLVTLAVLKEQRYILVTAGASGTPLTDARHIEDALKVYGSL